MATKTQQLRAALEARGFKRVESRSQRPCYTGLAKDGAPVWIWPDETGGMRYARTERIGDAISGLPTVKKVLAGLDSNILPLHPVALRIVPREPESRSPVSREEQRGARSELKDAQRKESDVLFEAAWAKLGYQYGADALEQVKLGWRLARGEL